MPTIAIDPTMHAQVVTNNNDAAAVVRLALVL